jgi:Holliday junction resolvasome RuvABC DNA-binding subunit
VLELKGKLKGQLYGEETRVPAGSGGDAVAKALEVLTGLGYTPAEAKEAVRQATTGNGGSHSVEQLVTVALKGLDRG